ncbi:MAG: hypothetical protein WCF33_00910 [Pseudonocardiaceae bacterium]
MTLAVGHDASATVIRPDGGSPSQAQRRDVRLGVPCGAPLAGIGAGVLTAFAGHPAPEAVLLGIGVTAGAIKFADWLIR